MIRKQNIRFALFISFQIIFSLSSWSQDMLGTSLGNYSGTNGIQLNPSIMNSSKAWLDVNILSGDQFLENNYLYMSRKDYRFNNFFQRGYEIPMHPENYGTEDRMFYWSNSTNSKDAFVNSRINGPGAMLLYGKHAFALTTALRSVFSVRNLPYDIANFSYLGLNYRPQHNINYRENKPFRSASMVWGEIGLSYSYEVYQRNYTKIDAGISVRRLFGYTGAYSYVTNMDYIVPDDSTIIVNNINAELGYALPLEYNTKATMYNGSMIKGGGFGFDIGITYTRLKRLHQNTYFTQFCSQPYEAYDYRIGVALIDVGAIRFRENALAARVDNGSSYWEDVRNFDYTTIEDLVDTTSFRFFGNDSAIYVDNSFMLWLPTAISVQGDYHIHRNWFVNGSLIMGIPLAHASLVRPAIVSVTPRYETSWFEVNVPVSLYDWYLPRMGLSLRAWFLTVGTEKLGQFFNFRDFTGMDVYFSVNFFLEKGSCRNSRQKGCADMEYQVKSK